MSFQKFVTEKLAALNSAVNTIATNAKKIDELPEQVVLAPASKIHVSKNGTSEKISIQKIINAITNNLNDKIISIGNISIVSNILTIPTNAIWQIGSVIYQTTSITSVSIPFCVTGKNRIDILVANTSNQIAREIGVETLGLAVRPNIPLNTILVTTINVSDSIIAPPTTPIIDATASHFKGNFNASTNLLPTLQNCIGSNGDFYQVIVAGNVDLGAGMINLSINDFIIYDNVLGIYKKFIDNNQSSQENWFESDFIMKSEFQDPFSYFQIGSGNSYYWGISNNFTKEIGTHKILSWFGSSPNNGLGCHTAPGASKMLQNRAFECNFQLLKNTDVTSRMGFMQIDSASDRVNPAWGIYLEVVNGIGTFKHKNNPLTSSSTAISMALNKNYCFFVVVLSATTSRFILTDLDTNSLVSDIAISTNSPSGLYCTIGFCSYETIAAPTTGLELFQIDKMGFGDVKKSQIIKYRL